MRTVLAPARRVELSRRVSSASTRTIRIRLFVNQNFLAAGFPLPILPSGLPADLNFVTPYVQQISFGIEQDMGHDISLNIAFNSTGGRHLNRPINVNPVNPQLLTANWRNAVNAVKAGLAPRPPRARRRSADGRDGQWSQSMRSRANWTVCGSSAPELLPPFRTEYFAGPVPRQSGGWRGSSASPWRARSLLQMAWARAFRFPSAICLRISLREPRTTTV